MTPKQKQIQCLESLDIGIASVEAHDLFIAKIVIHQSIYDLLVDYIKRTEGKDNVRLINMYKGIPLEVDNRLKKDNFLIETKKI